MFHNEILLLGRAVQTMFLLATTLILGSVLACYVLFDESIWLHSRSKEQLLWVCCYGYVAFIGCLQIELETFWLMLAVLFVLPFGYVHKSTREMTSLKAYARGTLHAAQLHSSDRAEALAGWVADMSRSIAFAGSVNMLYGTVTGHITKKRNKIVRVLSKCDQDELNFVLCHINLPKLIYGCGTDQLMSLLLVDREHDYVSLTRGVVIDACEKVFVQGQASSSCMALRTAAVSSRGCNASNVEIGSDQSVMKSL